MLTVILPPPAEKPPSSQISSLPVGAQVQKGSLKVTALLLWKTPPLSTSPLLVGKPAPRSACSTPSVTRGEGDVTGRIAVGAGAGEDQSSCAGLVDRAAAADGAGVGRAGAGDVELQRAVIGDVRGEERCVGLILQHERSAVDRRSAGVGVDAGQDQRAGAGLHDAAVGNHAGKRGEIAAREWDCRRPGSCGRRRRDRWCCVISISLSAEEEFKIMVPAMPLWPLPVKVRAPPLVLKLTVSLPPAAAKPPLFQVTLKLYKASYQPRLKGAAGLEDAAVELDATRCREIDAVGRLQRALGNDGATMIAVVVAVGVAGPGENQQAGAGLDDSAIRVASR